MLSAPSRVFSGASKRSNSYESRALTRSYFKNTYLRTGAILPYNECSGDWNQGFRWFARHTIKMLSRCRTEAEGMRNVFSVLALWLAGGAAVASAAPIYNVVVLGSLGGGGTLALGINRSGNVTGESLPASGREHAFDYSNGRMTDLGTLGGAWSLGEAINDSGQVAGWSAFNSNSDDFHAFLYSGGAMTDLGTLGGDSFGSAINNKGQVVGGYHTAASGASDFRAFLYSDGRMINLGTLGGRSSFASGINDRDQITGYAFTASGRQHVFVYEDGRMTDLGINGSGSAINDKGQVTGGSETASGFTHPFLYSAGSVIDLGTLGGFQGFGAAINNKGQVVGSYTTASGDDHAFLYSGGAMLDLNTLIEPTLGITLVTATGINDAGQIVADDSLNVGGHAYLLTPVPEPVTGFLFAVGLFWIGLTARLQRNDRLRMNGIKA